MPNWFWIIILIILIWIMILAIVFGALYFRVANTTTYGLSNESDNAQSDSYIMQNSVLPDDYQETASFKKDSYAVQKDNYLDDYYESKPNKYTQTLNRNELLYCMAEAIRIDAVRYKIDSYSKSEVDRYNLFINNYNDICYSKQYYEKDENYVQK
ncbi:MAG: hypothetical protein LBB59_05110 [Campylobacteraceae bacterium]|nr:hypothetical protein [Campylobacteraceae bacterium]